MFLWFYQLNIADALILLAVASLVGIRMYQLYSRRNFWNKAMFLMLVLWLAVVLRYTLTGRETGTCQAPVWGLFASYRAVRQGANPEIIRSNLMNVMLFYPAGMCAVMQNRKQGLLQVFFMTVCGLVLLSGCIELLQFRLDLGLAETDDIFHNGLGALLGAAAGSIPLLQKKWKKKENR